MTCRPASSRTKRQCSPFALMIYRAIVSAALNQKRCEPANKTPDHFISSNQLIGFPATSANYFLAVRCTREEKSPRMNSFSRLQSAPRCLNLNKINFFACITAREAHGGEALVYYCETAVASLLSRLAVFSIMYSRVISKGTCIFIHSQVRRGSRSRALFLSPFFLRWVSQTNAGWQATNKET
jgi:hypothetical protein